ncbi:thiamine phosphate synthase [Roseobacter denitrificans]|uniref:Thiamine-phosphate synthase n=1 Tax=Roseobacter denitrificans (strain ATCC 33942 / OCh 114) TaxID=375451 RepID=Q162K4_ROSDO|nr:thiamine phosphate synthase [Roseobacter denitrificans]ABG33089.1 bifunctional ThiED protein [Roseobacter denitrificans OCh 114]AVL52458.1 thiamine phosphate synthase [Roseobacter denitrificans]SFG08167.1 thiamine-phosphate diphosphorylase [Roseobacter denitrificans OCh 114]
MTGLLKDRLRLYLVTDPQLCAEAGVMNTVQRAVAGGVTMVQLRDKHAKTPERIELAIALKNALQSSGVPLVINDDVVAAVATDVDGAHIGQGDITPAEARAMLGPGRILGLSCETAQTVRDADPTLVDYLGLGPVFGTATKDDHAQPIGFDGLAGLVALSPLPTVAIGGLKHDHTNAVAASGADGMAVVSAICGQPDPQAAAGAFHSFKPEHKA